MKQRHVACPIPLRVTCPSLRYSIQQLKSQAPMTTSPLLPLTLRLNALEAQVHGFPSARPEAGPSRQRPITRRLTEINETLDGLCGESEALKRLLSGCEPGTTVCS